ncbi:hypothetical protein [Rhodoflexus sp.]
MQETDFSHFTLWEARFETNDLTPPPFSHYYHLIVRKEGGSYRASYELVYTHREEFTEEELAEEGFTLNDNRACEAVLHQVWIAQIEQLLAQTQPETRARQPKHNFLELHMVGQNGEAQTFRPKNRVAWEMLLQQVVQGLMETAQVEAPLILGYAWQAGGKLQQYQIRWQFADRSAVRVYESQTQQIPWQVAMAIMEQSFEVEPDYEKMSSKPKNGIEQISPGDGNWYALLDGQKNRWEALKETIQKIG